MLERLTDWRLVTPPAIWGKLPAHADFVRGRMRHGESEGWESWLARYGEMPGGALAAALPAAFVLPPGSVSFAPRRFVVGVVMPSIDKVGRHHALLVYQIAHPRWIERYFSRHASQPRDWLFWLARAVERLTGPTQLADVHVLARTLSSLWELHAPGWRALWRAEPDTAEQAAQRDLWSQAVVDRLGSASEDQSTRLRGVRHLPWADWPQRLFERRAGPAFWQQDGNGRFVNAADRLTALWGDAP